MRVLIGRHNGLGDLVMALPFIAACRRAHEVTVMTSLADNGEWLRWLLPWPRIVGLDADPYTDFRRAAPGYDVYLNLNHVELADDLASRLGIAPPNQQYHYALLAAARGLPVPASLAPSDHVNPAAKGPRGDGVLIFSRSTHPSRSLSPPVVAELLRRFPGAEVDPRFRSKVDLFLAIGRAGRVIGSDAGPIHAAEVMRTPALCLHTTMNHAVRHRFYRYVRGLQSAAAASPCFSHTGCDTCGRGRDCCDQFDWSALPDGFRGP